MYTTLNDIIDYCQDTLPYLDESNHFRFHELITHDNSYTDIFHALLGVVPKINMRTGPWIAGGTVRRLIEAQEYNGADFDFYFTSKEQLERFEKSLEPKHVLTYRSRNANTYLVNIGDDRLVTIQLIKKFFAKPFDVINTFDVTIVQGITDGRFILVGDDTLTDIKEKRIVFNKITKDYAAQMLKRIIKFANEGYTLSNGQSELFFKYLGVITQPVTPDSKTDISKYIVTPRNSKTRMKKLAESVNTLDPFGVNVPF